ncbi:hypothetical protein BG000_006421, partial [Podila horticola]
KYAPRPLATDARHSKLTKEVDSHFVKAQKQTAHLTRPLDLLLHQCLQTDDYEEVLELVIAFHRLFRRELMYHAAELNESRNHFLRKDRGLPQKEAVTPILSLKTIAEERKAFNAINKTMGFNSGNNNNNNNSNNNGNWNQNNRNSSQRQGNNQQQRNSNFAHNKNSNSFNNNNGNNNRSNNPTTHSDQGKGYSRGQSRGRSQSRQQGQQ